MQITNNLVILKEFNKFEPDKPYVLYIVGSGRVGDKLNCGVGLNGKSFPPEASSRFTTFDEAHKAYERFYAYVIDKIALSNSKKSGSSKLWE